MGDVVHAIEHQLRPAPLIEAEQDAPACERPPVDPKLVVPPMPPASQRRRVAFLVAAALSAALHATSLLAFLQWREETGVGAIATPNEAISVEIVESKVLQAIPLKQSSEPAPSIDATAPQEGSVEASAAHREKPENVVAPSPPIAAPVAPDEKTRVIQEEAPKTAEVAPLPVEGPGEKKEPEKFEEATQAKSKEEPDETERKQQAEEAQHKERERQKQAKADAHAGGPTSRGSEGKDTGGMHASASAGALVKYAAHVHERVTRNKPAGRGVRGKAVVTFTITESGTLANVVIARSSGKPWLDQAILSAVQSAAPFPIPPAGATAAQLQYSIPFHFE